MNYHINSTTSGKTEDSTELNAVFFVLPGDPRYRLKDWRRERQRNN